MRKNRVLIVLFVCISVFCGATSCTYDYFEDETNYQVFVPEVLDNSISDCRVAVYTEDGTLVRERYAAYPWGDDPRIQIGLFSFKLLPGKYNVYCFTNTEEVIFSETQSLAGASFRLHEEGGSTSIYGLPPDILFDTFTPQIIHPGIIKVDTAAVDHFNGRITVRFENFPANTSLIHDVQLRAIGASVKQNVKDLRITGARISDNDVMRNLTALPPGQGFSYDVEVDHPYFPTVNDGEVLTLEYTFLDSSGGTVIRLPVEFTDRSTGLPLVLHSNERVIIIIDSYTVVGITIVGWDEDIQSTDRPIG